MIVVLGLVLLANQSVDSQPLPPLKVATLSGAQLPVSTAGRFFYGNVEGEYGGLEYQILEYFAKREGRELEIVIVEGFAELFPAVESGLVDIGVGTITVTPEREQRMDFSDSYFPVRVILVEPTNETTTTIAGLAGKRIGSFPDLNPDFVLREETAKVPGIEIVYPSGTESAIEMLKAGEIDAYISDTTMAFEDLRNDPSIHMTLVLGEEEHFGFAVPLGSPLRSKLNAHLRELKRAQIYYRLLEEHFGLDAARTINLIRDLE